MRRRTPPATLLALLLLQILAAASPAWAQDDDEAPDTEAEFDLFGRVPKEGGEGEADERTEEERAYDEVERRARQGLEAERQGGPPAPGERSLPRQEEWRQQRAMEEALRRQLADGPGRRHLEEVTGEMISLVIDDLRRLNRQAISPMALRGVELSPNLSRPFGRIVAGRLQDAIKNRTALALKVCDACEALGSRIEGDDWVVTQGVVGIEDLRREAERLGVEAFLDVNLVLFPEQRNLVAMQVELLRARDNAVLWSQTYHSDPSTGVILRTTDRDAERGARLDELARKEEEDPDYTHSLMVGYALIPYNSPLYSTVSGITAGYRLQERFGTNQRYSYGVGIELFLDTAIGVPGAFLEAVGRYQLNEPMPEGPRYATGPVLGGFVAGAEGNSLLAGWGFEAMLRIRLGGGASLFYFVPTDYDGSELGGVSFKLHASFNW